jgi:putative peptide zinc metalloprotease protein
VAVASGDTVANENVASAYASCTDCRTVAAAVQVLVVDGSATDFRPVNVAVALNENCLRCQTFAYARQVVIRSATPARLGDDAEDAIEDIDERIGEVVRSRRPFPEMTASLDRLAERMAAVVRAEIARAGSSGHEDDHREVHEDHDDH